MPFRQGHAVRPGINTIARKLAAPTGVLQVKTVRLLPFLNLRNGTKGLRAARKDSRCSVS